MVWNKLDEVLGVLALSVIAIIAMILRYDLSIISACVAGVIALLVVKKNGEK